MVILIFLLLTCSSSLHILDINPLSGIWFIEVYFYFIGCFLFFVFSLFYWSIIALQCCVRFCCTVNWISYVYTYIPSLLVLPAIPPPSQPWTSQSTELSFLCFIAGSQCRLPLLIRWPYWPGSKTTHKALSPMATSGLWKTVMPFEVWQTLAELADPRTTLLHFYTKAAS